MTAVTDPTSYPGAREGVLEAVNAGAILPEIEDGLLERVRLSPDARDALWLLAWQAIERRDSRQHHGAESAPLGRGGSQKQ